MAASEIDIIDDASSGAYRRRFASWRWRVSFGLLAIVAVTILAAWLSRERLADDYIADQLDQLGLEASYRIEEIGGTRQVISNLVVGDPANPDFTADQVTVFLRYRLGLPTLGRIELARPRLYGSLHGGKLSFGSLDPVIFTDSKEPLSLPDIDIRIADGRALLDTDFGPVGIKLEGEGELDSGFSGIVAASAPSLAVDACSATRATVFGKLTTHSGKPRFEGPVRLAALACENGDIALRKLDIAARVTGDADLAGFDSQLRFATRSLATPVFAANGANGTLDTVYGKDRLSSRYTLALRGAANDQLGMAVVTAAGSLRAAPDLSQMQIDSEIEGNGLRFGAGLTSSLASWEASSAGTLAAPLLRRVKLALDREQKGSELTARLTLRTSAKGFDLVIPQARLVGGNGATLLALSQVQYDDKGTGLPRLLGNFTSGGQGLPRITGRIEQGGKGNPLLRMRMAEYAAGDASLSVPELIVAQADNGGLGFSGTIEASGPLPGGSIRGARLPISGNYAATRGLTMWRGCTSLQFEQLTLASLQLERNGVKLCPTSAGAILRPTRDGLAVAATIDPLEMSGRLADTPITIRSGPVDLVWPGALKAQGIDVALGPPESVSHLSLASLEARFGADIGGVFAGLDAGLHAVPMDIGGGSGQWKYEDRRLLVHDAAFTLSDRQEQARFEPLVARDAKLTLSGGRISALAQLRHPASDRVVTSVAIIHDLDSATGHAELDVASLTFDRRLQPDQLSKLALGVIANAKGTVTGTGRIDWRGDEVTSSGRFSSDGIDFAAAFGPVGGASGTVEFVDLVNLTTAPRQELRIASINPGVEIFDGKLVFAFREGRFISVSGGSWPFMGGTLRLLPVELDIDSDDSRRYVLRIEGLDAALFIQQMELGNLTARGVFDGEVPLVFDADGNGRIEGGLLVSQPPGGNLSYVGELTYKDLSPMANFAFDTLRSLDFSRMEVDMNGPLTGEIITRLRFEGVRQGDGARKNFVTRQIAKLPVRFRVNIRADFYSLLTNFKSMYDPAFVRDPRELGLLTTDGTRLIRPEDKAKGAENRSNDELPIQTPESEKMP